MIWIQDLYFDAPQLLWAIPLALLIGAVLISRRAKGKLFAASRLLVFCLIIAAAANPYFVELHTVSSQKPSITILDDQTGSMGIFDPLVASRIVKYVDAPLRTFSGDTTPLGDRIVQYSLPGSSLLLVSDGYSNAGRSLEDALALARASNTTTFAISLAPQRDDAGVEISGTNTAVLGGDYPFKVLVRSSRGYQGPLSVFADDKLIYSDTIVANNSASIKISHSFLETGNHIIRASIAPDEQPINDNYQKAVYVVPKPQVLLVSSTNSPLAIELNDLYKLTLVSDLPDGLDGYKAVVLDDIKYSTHLDELKSYVREGGGLVVVGGEDSYENGNYRNSSLEEILPVRSMPSIFEGGKTLIFVMDISFSLLTTRTADGTPLLDYEKSLALELLKSPHFQDYKVGLIVFGTKAYDVQDPIPLRRAETVLRERIMSLAPTGTENSYLDSGLQLARDMLNVSGGQGELMILSDGNLYNYPEVVTRSIDLLRQMNVSARLVQVQAFPGATGRFNYIAAQTGSDYSAFVYPDSLTTTMQQQPELTAPEESSPSGYAVGIVNKDHYITADLDLNTTVTGFNDVTPRAGAQRLAAMPDGKPVLTVWRYGLGRVAALTVDDGSAWAGNLYASPSSQLISATLNWAVGDPRPQEDRIEADDGWTGTPLSVTINSPARPSFPEADVEKVGDNRYVATFVPNSSGIYYIGNYGLAVNYPLEYRNIGVNLDFSRMIMANGGKVFSEDEAREKLVVEASRVSQRTLQERISRRDILLLIALLIFLTEIIYRKMDEVRRRGRSRA
ncbi:MAG: glutamine amidotransferase [Methanothrix sp.]|nr:glutamine amidotransferase [Methanothrix sp.]